MQISKKCYTSIVMVVILSILSSVSFALGERESSIEQSLGIYYLRNTYEIWEDTSTNTRIQSVNYTYYSWQSAYTATYQYNDFSVYRNGIYLGSQNGSMNNTSTMLSRLNVSGAYTDAYTIRGYARATCPLGDIAYYHNYN